MTRSGVLAAVSKLLGLVIFLVGSATLYDLVSSPAFTLSQVSVSGNQLLTAEEVGGAGSMAGTNLFWLRRGELNRRLEQIPPIEHAEVSLYLPDRIHIAVKERDPVAVWLSGDVPYLVDRSGLVLAARPPGRPLMTIRDASLQPLTPGSRVSADAVQGVATLDRLLKEAFGAQQREYEYAEATGINVVQSVGPRLILGSGDDLEWKVAAVQTIVRHLETSRGSAEVIDVRFGDRPYFR